VFKSDHDDKIQHLTAVAVAARQEVVLESVARRSVAQPPLPRLLGPSALGPPSGVPARRRWGAVGRGRAGPLALHFFIIIFIPSILHAAAALRLQHLQPLPLQLSKLLGCMPRQVAARQAV
jgi:hypothetical protein